jgi:hypothetical protein
MVVLILGPCVLLRGSIRRSIVFIGTPLEKYKAFLLDGAVGGGRRRALET